MGRLLNVRLSDEESAMVARLRRKGVTISDVVRAALRAEAANRHGGAGDSPAELLQDLHRRYGGGRTRRKRRVDTTNRREVSAHIKARLRREKGSGQ